ncbi:hypothetical protein AXF42_Ash007689 [Apostasia shenzhenica]|uniref:UspA domain-containing protein n=1 Tax=Apostasia shenzhenica TaxID=1088818 RepID=A0A2I0A671_9ASPA|nr:hypothetical protein AXF42_Ash007689 [Apostasia shenzhenica]
MPSLPPEKAIKKLKSAGESVPAAAMDSASRRGQSPAKRRVMVVADPGRESAAALQWALSHAILDQDDLILLHVEPAGGSRRGGPLSAFLRRPASLGPGGGTSGSIHHHYPGVSSLSLSSISLSSTSPATSSAGSTCNASSAGVGEGAEYEFLEAMRAACEAAQPKIRVQIERVEMEGRDKAAAILSQTKTLGVDLLVIGQRRPSSSFLGCRLSGSISGKGLDMAEFLIEHCKCLCVGVQKKGQNAGYLLNTKTHKNFWLLA